MQDANPRCLPLFSIQQLRFAELFIAVKVLLMNMSAQQVSAGVTKNGSPGNSLVVQWLGLRAFTGEGAGSIPGWGTKITQDTWHSQKKKRIVAQLPL